MSLPQKKGNLTNNLEEDLFGLRSNSTKHKPISLDTLRAAANPLTIPAEQINRHTTPKSSISSQKSVASSSTSSSMDSSEENEESYDEENAKIQMTIARQKQMPFKQVTTKIVNSPQKRKAEATLDAPQKMPRIDPSENAISDSLFKSTNLMKVVKEDIKKSVEQTGKYFESIKSNAKMIEEQEATIHENQMVLDKQEEAFAKLAAQREELEEMRQLVEQEALQMEEEKEAWENDSRRLTLEAEIGAWEEEKKRISALFSTWQCTNK